MSLGHGSVLGFAPVRERLSTNTGLVLVLIIGVGLVGGSVGLAIKARDGRIHVAGVGRRDGSLRTAMKVGVIDSAHSSTFEAVAFSDLVILATPVGAFGDCLRAINPPAQAREAPARRESG